MAPNFLGLTSASPRDKNSQNCHAQDHFEKIAGKGTVKAGTNTKVDGLDISPQLGPTV